MIFHPLISIDFVYHNNKNITYIYFLFISIDFHIIVTKNVYMYFTWVFKCLKTHNFQILGFSIFQNIVILQHNIKIM